MNPNNSTEILIRKRDYFKLPAHMRKVSDGPMVLSKINGSSTFIKVRIIN